MDYREIFDNNVSPEDFDKWRTRYCDELFADVIEYSKLDSSKTALEIGPRTGQAYKNVTNYGFTDFECRHYHKVREEIFSIPTYRTKCKRSR